MRFSLTGGVVERGVGVVDSLRRALPDPVGKLPAPSCRGPYP